MQRLFRGYRLILLLVIATIALWSSMCNSKGSAETANVITHPNGKAFAGSEACQSCHRDIYASHLRTAHYRTSRPSDSTNIRGSFASGRNVFRFSDSLQAVMEKTDSGFYQAGYFNGKEFNRKQMDITVGSGRKGQTYLYWWTDYLFQLPISYYTPDDVWCNSPGYPTTAIRFNRSVPGACIECHGTFLKGSKDQFGRTAYDRNSIIYGVDCERCHGPAGEHVAFQQEHPEEKSAKFVINPGKLSRQQKLDNCALCHSGVRSHALPSFSYVTGDKLDNYSTANFYVADSTAPIDVHGNQYGLLSASKCFRVSKTMNCSSCHDVHQDQSGNLKAFSSKCMNCHNNHDAPFCPKAVHSGPLATTNCIDCHMPALPSRKIFLEVSDKKDPVPALIRTHLIAKYSDQRLAQIKKLIENFK